MDTGASVIARLKQKSRNTGKSLQTYLQLFCQEEFLRRLSLSKYNKSLILKGGLFELFAAWDPSRGKWELMPLTIRERLYLIHQ